MERESLSHLLVARTCTCSPQGRSGKWRIVEVPFFPHSVLLAIATATLIIQYKTMSTIKRKAPTDITQPTATALKGPAPEST